LYVSPNIKIIKSRMRFGWVCGTYGEERNACSVVVGNPERRRRLGWEDNIKMCLKEVGWEEVD
jgi:hypothetical protein